MEYTFCDSPNPYPSLKSHIGFNAKYCFTSVLAYIVIAYILIAQLVIMILTFSKGIKDIVLWYQSKRKIQSTSSSIMTEKSVLSKVVDDQKPDFLYTNTLNPTKN